MPRFKAFWRSAPTLRLVIFAIFITGVLAFEWTLSSLISAFVHSRRLTLFLVAFFTMNAPF
ncbi:hypothetical protein MA20_35005 [Bradyrhizobium japonicum]|uniref:Uncharacterized protein n=1 Tax=Bradyrhizobium japonicum TaxID=375 RepID=A0A0A3XPS9_BRAJP|nr:hypothetical protein RN69_37775 [Bradyrhizobium japonicum]AND87614.1 hypothetical protein AAV28_07190 [Bradyrhizobium diazoefficiens USDA 110]KOY04634.1 hypothetical protein AF336_41015 [Bradyrhizobium diazoefficiens]APG14743.1 hypothetical protein BKD09_40970 [Bradyrhizobium japonicum]KGT75146.1 hypothetical protein MA20_35005 [Bradyrhizobium japonicum]